MISVRSLRDPSPSTAALVRLAAFLVGAVSAVLIPIALCAAALGRTSVPTAFAVTAIAVGLTLVATIAARSLDPMRR